MPANGRGGSLKAGFTESATENVPPVLAGPRRRKAVKAHRGRGNASRQGKPHVEQDQIGEEERPAPLRLPGRSLELGSNLRPRGMVAACGASRGYRNRLIVREALFQG